MASDNYDWMKEESDLSKLEELAFDERDKNALLMEAACDVNLIVMQLAIKHGADVDTIGFTTRKAPLHCVCDSPMAAMKGLAGIALLIRAGANPNIREADGDTPLCSAIQCSPTLVKPLIEAGCDPNIPGTGGLSPLHLAVAKGSSAVVEALLLAGAKASEKTPAGDAPIAFAAKRPSNSESIEIARLLAAAGASGDETDASGRTAHELAAANSPQMALAVRGALPPKPPTVVVPPPVVAPPRIYPR